MELTYSVIIPVYNEANNVQACINRLLLFGDDIEIILVDGGSTDKTIELIKQKGIKVYNSKKGRGTQCNVGVQKASYDILVFLHADTILPDDAFRLIQSKVSHPNFKIGTFLLRFDQKHWFLEISSFFTRFDTIFTKFGDQCIVVKKDFFNQIGGFPDWPLFEDVHLLRLARKRTKIVSFPYYVITSARKFLKHGIIRQQLRNGMLIIKYLMGVSPQCLAEQYYKKNG